MAQIVCTSDLGTGEVYTCYDHDCPAHGARNREFDGQHRSNLWRAVADEIANLETLLFLTPYLGELLAMLRQLKTHLERKA